MRATELNKAHLTPRVAKLDLLGLIQWLGSAQLSLNRPLPGLDLDQSALEDALALDLTELNTIDQWFDQFLKRKFFKHSKGSLVTVAAGERREDGLDHSMGKLALITKFG